MLSYKLLDSLTPTNITLNILQSVRRWIRNPLKNKGLSIQIRSSLGVDQPVEGFVDLPTQCLSEPPQPGKNKSKVSL